MNGEQRAEAVFGSFDGATGAVGVVTGALVAHASPHTLLLIAGGSAVANAVSMAAGDRTSGKSWALSIVMGVATLVGALVPALPVALVHGWLGIAWAVALLAGLGVLIAELHRQDQPRAKSYRRTFLLLFVASALAAGATVGLGATG